MIDPAPVSLLARYVKPSVSDEQAQKIDEINNKIKQFLESSDREKIFLIEPTLKLSLVKVMNPDLLRLNKGKPDAFDLNNPFIHYPRFLSIYNTDFQFIDYEFFMENVLSITKEFPLIPSLFNKTSIDEFLKQAIDVIKKIETGTQQIEKERERDTQIANAMPHLRNLSKSLDLKALVALLTDCVNRENFLAGSLMDICSNILSRLYNENISANNLIDLRSPISLDFPKDPHSFPLDKHFYGPEDVKKFKKRDLPTEIFDPFTQKIRLIQSLRSARPEYFQKALNILKTILKETAPKEATFKEETAREEPALQKKTTGEEIIRDEFQKGKGCWDEYVKDTEPLVKKVRVILKASSPFMMNAWEFSLPYTQENPLKNKNTNALITYVAEVLERNDYGMINRYENVPLFIQLLQQIDQAYVPIQTPNALGNGNNFFQSVLKTQSFISLSNNDQEQIPPSPNRN